MALILHVDLHFFCVYSTPTPRPSKTFVNQALWNLDYDYFFQCRCCISPSNLYLAFSDLYPPNQWSWLSLSKKIVQHGMDRVSNAAISGNVHFLPCLSVSLNSSQHVRFLWKAIYWCTWYRYEWQFTREGNLTARFQQLFQVELEWSC